MYAVKILGCCKKLDAVLAGIIISLAVGNNIYGVCQNIFDCKPRKALALPGFISPDEQKFIGFRERPRFGKFRKNKPDKLRFPRDNFELASFSRFPVKSDRRDAFGFISRGRYPAEPAPCLCKLAHVVAYPLGNRFALKLRKNRRDIHHRPPHR